MTSKFCRYLLLTMLAVAGVSYLVVALRPGGEVAGRHRRASGQRIGIITDDRLSRQFDATLEPRQSRDFEPDRSAQYDILRKLTLAGDAEAVERLLRQEVEATAAKDAGRQIVSVNAASETSGVTGHAVATNPINFRTPNAYLITRRMQLHGTFSIFFRMKTIQSDGLIFFAAGGRLWQSSSASYVSSNAADDAWGIDFIAVELVGGHLRYVFNVTGAGMPRTVRPIFRQTLSDNRWHEVTIMRPTLSQHIVRVDETVGSFNVPDATEFEFSAERDTVHQRRTLDGESAAIRHADDRSSEDRSMIPVTVLFVGGVPIDKYDLLPKPIKSRHGFQGCLASVEINGDPDGLHHASEVPVEHQLDIGTVCHGPECTITSCANGGECIQKWNSYSCNCDMTSFTGDFCTEDGIVYLFGGDEEEAQHYKHGGYSVNDGNDDLIKFTFGESEKNNTYQDKLAFGLRTRQTTAALVRILGDSLPPDFIQVDLTDGTVSITYNVGSGEHVIGSVSHRVNDDNYHVIGFIRNGSSGTLYIDGRVIHSKHNTGSKDNTFNRQSVVYVGSEPLSSDSSDMEPFKGSIAGLVFNGLHILRLAAETDARAEFQGHPQLDTKPLQHNVNGSVADTHVTVTRLTPFMTSADRAREGLPLKSVTPTSTWSIAPYSRLTSPRSRLVPSTSYSEYTTPSKPSAHRVSAVTRRTPISDKPAYQPTTKSAVRRQSLSALTDDLIVSDVTTNCPFDDSVSVQDCSRHESTYTDALLLPVSKIVSFTRNFPRSGSTPSYDAETELSSGREPCLQDDEDCDMFSGDNEMPSRITTNQKKHDGSGGRQVIVVQTSSQTSIAAAAAAATVASITTETTIPVVTSRAKRRRTTAPGQTASTASSFASLSTEAATGITTSASKTLRPAIVTLPPTPISTASTTSSSSPLETTPRHFGIPTRRTESIIAGTAPYVGSNNSGSGSPPIIGDTPLIRGVYGNGEMDIARMSDIERLKWNIGLIIAVAICLAILFLVLAFVIHRYRGIVGGSGHRALHHRHSLSGGGGSKAAVNSEVKGTGGCVVGGVGYVYETCNTLPATPASTAQTRPLVINRSANITSSSSSATAMLLPQQQSSNGSRKEVKEWYV